MVRCPPLPLLVPLLVVAADLLFLPTTLGCGAAALIAGLAAIFAWRLPALWRTRRGLIGLVALVAIAGSLAIEPGPFAIVLALLGLPLLGLLGRGGGVADGCDLLAGGGRFLLCGPVLPWLELAAWIKACAARPGRLARWLGRLWAWVLPLAIGALFAVCFLIANPLPGQWLGELFAMLLEWTLPHPLRVFCWVMLGLLLWTCLRPRLRARMAWLGNDADNPRRERIAGVIRALVVCNLVFAGQNLLDLRYLWGGAALPTGMTFATYAHRGAYALVATALLAGAFVLLWFRPGYAVNRDRRALALVLAWIGQNVLLLAGSAWRLQLYVDAYGLTRWRCAAAVWMVLVAIGLGILAWRILARRSNRILVNFNLTTLAVTLVAILWVDWAGLIAWHNVHHGHLGEDGRMVDQSYLSELGLPAAPALLWHATHAASAAERSEALMRAHKLLQTSDLPDGWRGLSLRRSLTISTINERMRECN